MVRMPASGLRPLFSVLSEVGGGVRGEVSRFSDSAGGRAGYLLVRLASDNG